MNERIACRRGPGWLRFTNAHDSFTAVLNRKQTVLLLLTSWVDDGVVDPAANQVLLSLALPLQRHANTSGSADTKSQD